MATPRETAEQFFAAIEVGDVDRALGLLAANVQFTSPGSDFDRAADVRHYLETFVNAFPDAKFNVSRALESGSTVALEGVYGGTHTGPMRTPDGAEIPATGREAQAPFVTVFEVEDGQIISHASYWDQLTFIGQLSLLPKA